MTKINRIFGIVGLVFALALLVAPALTPHADALTTAQKTSILTSSTDAVDNDIVANFGTVVTYTVGYTLLFGFVAVVLSMIWKGIRTLMGKLG